MAININFNGASLRKPGTYSKTSVNLTGGFPLAPAGTVAIVGESDKGMPGSADDIRLNYFSPEQFSDVVAKYSSGPIVDAFRLLITPSSDARIVNGAQRVYIYKTNISTVASSTLPTAYGTITSKNYGLDENTISFQTTSAQAESGPAIASFNIMTDTSTASAVKVRFNGGASVTVAVPASTTPAAFVVAWNAAVGAGNILAAGGTDQLMIQAGKVGDGSKIAIAFTGLVAAITTDSSDWSVTPTVGDTIYISTTSVLKGVGTENTGAYLVLTAAARAISALKISDPLAVVSDVALADIASATVDCAAFAPVSLTYAATTAAGTGASIELTDGSAALAFGDLIYGGSDRGLLTSTQVADGSQIKLTASGSNVVIQIDSTFAALATVGDLLVIRGDSVLKGAALQNVGSYLVTAATVSTISATKYSGSPATVAYTDILATTDALSFVGMISSSAVSLVETSVAEAKSTITLNRQSDDTTETSVALGGTVALKIGYYQAGSGTTATMTINSTTLNTTITGGTGSSLSLTLNNYNTIQELVAYINAQTGYTAEAGSGVLGGYPLSILDRVITAGIGSSVDGSMPGRVKKDSYDVQEFFDSTVLCDLTRTLVTGYKGLPSAMTSATFLTGGAKGGTTAASVTTGIDELQKVRINTLVPLFSRNASYDILDELTEPSSTYQISAVNAAVKTHCLLMSDTKHRSERNAFCSYKGAYADAKTESTTLASERVSLCLQDVKVLKTDGTLDWVAPWGMGCIAAGMQAGAQIGEPMTFKFINVSGIRSTGFDPSTQYDDGIDYGLLFAEQPSQGGFRIVVGNTTYGKDANFVYNRISVLYAADSVAYNLRQQLEAIFIGVGLANASAASIRNTIVSILNTFRSAGMIVGDDTNGGNGFKNLLVRITGNVVYIDVTITPVQGIDFILPSIVLDTIQQTA